MRGGAVCAVPLDAIQVALRAKTWRRSTCGSGCERERESGCEARPLRGKQDHDKIEGFDTALSMIAI